jgi:TPR repeat protein
MKPNKNVIALILGVSLTFGCLTAFAFESTAPKNAKKVVQWYYQAAKRGDVDAMKRYVSGRYYERLEKLFTFNSEYSRFLKNNNKGAALFVESTENLGSSVHVTVSRKLKGETFGETKLVLEQNESGEWKIIDEIFE